MTIHDIPQYLNQLSKVLGIGTCSMGILPEGGRYIAHIHLNQQKIIIHNDNLDDLLWWLRISTDEAKIHHDYTLRKQRPGPIKKAAVNDHCP